MSNMNGFADQGLSEDSFGAAQSGIKSFDAFPKTKSTYLTQTRSGGIWTILLTITCAYLAITETIRWFTGTTVHTFSVEKGVSHELQINLDVIVAMKCQDIHINVQDASGDRILAGEMLKKEGTNWMQWRKQNDKTEAKRIGAGNDYEEAGFGRGEDEDVHDYLGAARKRRKFKKTPRIQGPEDSCRVYGSLEGNKVQGDFHLTARGHGYMEFGEHLDHSTFNFSHQINELSFGPFYPSLVNPLDNHIATTPAHFYKFQYYLSVVPTIYTTDYAHLASIQSQGSASDLDPSSKDAPINPFAYSADTVFTNQYAVTEQSHLVGESQVPGVFFKFDIEPIMLTIAEEWGGLLGLIVKLVNVVSGVMVTGGWLVQLIDWAQEVRGRRRDRQASMGMLHGGMGDGEKKGF